MSIPWAKLFPDVSLKISSVQRTTDPKDQGDKQHEEGTFIQWKRTPL